MTTSEEIRRRFAELPGDDYVPALETALRERGHGGRKRGASYTDDPAPSTVDRRRYSARPSANLDGYEACVVPGCMVWSRALDRAGRCPQKLWDDRHYAYRPT